MKNILIDLMSRNNYIPFHKNIAKLIGVRSALVLSELCNTYSINNYTEFTETREDIIENTCLSEWDVRVALSTLESIEIISIKYRDIPRRAYITINEDKIIELLEKKQKIKEKTSSTNTLLNNSAEHYYCEVESTTPNILDNELSNINKKELLYNNNSNYNKNVESTELDSTSTENKVDLFNLFSKNESNLEDRLGDIVNPISNEAKRLFDYWNSKKLRVHRGYQSKYIERFEKLIKKIDINVIYNAIDNYEKVQHDEQFFWNYVWDLQDFIDPKDERYKRFISGGDIWEKYIEGNKSQQSFKKSSFFNEEYNEAIRNGTKIEDLDNKHTKENKEWRKRKDVIHL